MTYIFLFFAAILVWLSFKSFRGGITYVRFFRDQLARPRSDFTPSATVIAPCRGLDEGLRENYAALLDQDYPEHEVIFVVDDPADPAVAVIDEVSANSSKRSQLVISPKATASAQKIESLREAVLHAEDRSQVFVFVDSDVRPSRDWLRSLVAPLADPSAGAATGYRWFISEKPTFASEMRSVWNASIASALGPNARSNFSWGGSTAIRREVFDSLDVREKWRGTLADDFALTRVLKKAGLPIVFVPRALTASVGDCTLSQLLEFTNRQMKITRVYMPHLWLISFFGSALFCGIMLAAFFVVIFSSTNSLAVWASLATLLLVTVFSVGKSSLRLSAVRLALADHEDSLRRQFWTQNTLWLLAPGLFLCNSIAALFSRTITWRGIAYKLKSPTETVIIRD
jgi:cellulose synthase/poly-beta-1,6-N-acetylglucosamine synthase-like glycosyltransferase